MDLPVQQLPGVGWTQAKKLAELKIQTVADIRASGKPYLQRELGDKTGEQLWRSAHGKDDREVEPIQMRKCAVIACTPFVLPLCSVPPLMP